MSRSDPCVYLTFDDGPHPDFTPPILDLLKANGVKATFFLIGNEARKYPDIVRRIVTEGHAIGNHSMTHPRMLGIPARDQLADIASADEVLAAFNGRARQIFRPPNGRATWAIIAHCVRERQPMILWSIDSLDFQLRPEQVVARLQEHPIRHGDILLFHDDGECAGKALEQLLPVWRNTGMRFAALELRSGLERSPATC